MCYRKVQGRWQPGLFGFRAYKQVSKVFASSVTKYDFVVMDGFGGIGTGKKCPILLNSFFEEWGPWVVCFNGIQNIGLFLSLWVFRVQKVISVQSSDLDKGLFYQLVGVVPS